MLRRSIALLFAMLLTLGTAGTALADPPADRVSGIDEVADVTCEGGAVLVRERSGWVGLPTGQDLDLNYFHIAVTYANEDGDTWMFQGTGLIRFYERQGDEYISLSGHSDNIDDGNGWYGHWELNFTTGDVKLVGSARGNIDDAACDALT